METFKVKRQSIYIRQGKNTQASYLYCTFYFVDFDGKTLKAKIKLQKQHIIDYVFPPKAIVLPEKFNRELIHKMRDLKLVKYENALWEQSL